MSSKNILRAKTFTPRRLEILSAYLEYVDAQETYPPLAPTIRFLRTATGMSSTSMVAFHLRVLVDRGIMKHVLLSDDTYMGRYLIDNDVLLSVRDRVGEFASRSLHEPRVVQDDPPL